jgi:hypothetical protein
LVELRCVQTITIGNRPVVALALASDPSRLAIVDASGRAQVTPLPRSDEAKLFTTQISRVRGDAIASVVFMERTQGVAIGGPDRGIRIWEF